MYIFLCIDSFFIYFYFYFLFPPSDPFGSEYGDSRDDISYLPPFPPFSPSRLLPRSRQTQINKQTNKQTKKKCFASRSHKSRGETTKKRNDFLPSSWKGVFHVQDFFRFSFIKKKGNNNNSVQYTTTTASSNINVATFFISSFSISLSFSLCPMRTSIHETLHSSGSSIPFSLYIYIYIFKIILVINHCTMSALPYSRYPDEDSSEMAGGVPSPSGKHKKTNHRLRSSTAGGLRRSWDTPSGEEPYTSAEDRDAATQRLFRLCQQSADLVPDPVAIEACVAAGANVTYQSPYADLPILHDLVQKGYAACVAACLKTNDLIDFNSEGGEAEEEVAERRRQAAAADAAYCEQPVGAGAVPLEDDAARIFRNSPAPRERLDGPVEAPPSKPRRGEREQRMVAAAAEAAAEAVVAYRRPKHSARGSWSLLRCVLMVRNAKRCRAIMELLVRRLLETHPFVDIVDWRHRNADGRDFLADAIYYQRLSDVWPCVRRIPHFVALKKPIVLADGVYCDDWSALRTSEKKDFKPVSYTTSTPHKPTPNLLAVQQHDADTITSLLFHIFIFVEDIECIFYIYIYSIFLVSLAAFQHVFLLTTTKKKSKQNKRKIRTRCVYF
eukprot:gene2175-1344_t